MALLFGSACILLAAGHDVIIQGAPGVVTIVAEGDLSVRSESAGDRVRWHLAIPEKPLVPDALREWVRAESGGFVVDLPAGGSPTLTWSSKGLEFRWSAGAGGRDLFVDEEPPVYPLGPGDKLQITVYNVEDMEKTVVVDPKGNLTFPVLGMVPVEGSTVSEFQRDMEKRLADFVKEPQVSIQVLEYGSRSVNVLGDVGAPGRIPIKGALRVLDAISQAGGFTEKSGDVEVKRRSPSGEVQSRVIPRDDLLTGEKDTHNFFVRDQDVINVQPLKSVYVSGEVKAPGSFPFSKDMTFLRAIAKAGGFGQWAKKGSVDILREKPGGGHETLQVDASDIERGKAPDVPLLPNDHIVVKERKFL